MQVKFKDRMRQGKPTMNILLIGCGKMGGAMLSAWLAQGIIKRGVIVNRAVYELRQQFKEHSYLLDIYPDVKSLPPDVQVDLVVLGVKPQQMAEMLTELAPHLKPEWPILTIAAGLRQNYYARYLPQNLVIRAMPNTPVLIGQGMTVAVGDAKISAPLQTQIETLLQATGDFFWLHDEEELDAAMSISGSGPAYFFYLAESLAKAGIGQGLTEEQAMRLARQTLIGAGALAAKQNEKTLEHMRRDVTSPGGVTEATIKVWDNEDAFYTLITTGLTENIKRANELGGKA